MELTHEKNKNYDFNAPITLMEVCKHRINFEDALTEVASKITIGWEEVVSIKQYTYPEVWKDNPGEKFYVKIRSSEDILLVLGNHDEFVELWSIFRTKYPLFRTEIEEE